MKWMYCTALNVNQETNISVHTVNSYSFECVDEERLLTMLSQTMCYLFGGNWKGLADPDSTQPSPHD